MVSFIWQKCLFRPSTDKKKTYQLKLMIKKIKKNRKTDIIILPNQISSIFLCNFVSKKNLNLCNFSVFYKKMSSFLLVNVS